MYYVLVYHNAPECRGGKEIARVTPTDTLGEAEAVYGNEFDDPANAGCWVEIAVQKVRRYRCED
jgi:hypothetical protein